MGSGETTSSLLLSPEDLVVDRLAGFQLWRSEVDFENARLLLQRVSEDLDLPRLERLADAAGVSESLNRLLDEVDSR